MVTVVVFCVHNLSAVCEIKLMASKWDWTRFPIESNQRDQAQIACKSQGQTTLVELKFFTNLIDAIVNLPKAEREAMRRTLEETFRLVDTTLNMVIIRLDNRRRMDTGEAGVPAVPLERFTRMTEHNLFYCPYASFANAQLPLLKVAALYFDRLTILDPVGASWARIGEDHDREVVNLLKTARAEP